MLFSETPLPVSQVVLVSKDEATMDKYAENLGGRVKSIVKVHSAQQLAAGDSATHLASKESIIVYTPGQVRSPQEVPEAAESFISELLDLVKFVANSSLPNKVFVLTNRVFAGETNTALAQGPLHGLGRIIASEQPDIWGGLIDTEDWTFPLQAIKYVQGQDVTRIEDGVPRTARLRPLAP